MPLIGLSRKKKNNTVAPGSPQHEDHHDHQHYGQRSYGSASYRTHPAQHHATPSPAPESYTPTQTNNRTAQPHPADPSLSKTTINLSGLPLTVFGLSNLTPSSSRSSAPDPPPVCISIHIHGRGGSAETDDDVCRGIYTFANHEARRRGRPTKELLVVSFDARNHGHRLTNELAQKGWGKGNDKHAMDLYSSILGTAADVSFIADFLPAYLFPQDDRQVTSWCVTGKSMGGHCVYHVLKDDPRISIGVSMIGMPDFTRLLDFRTKQAFIRNGPPYVPAALKDLIKRRDPANVPYDRQGSDNPYWGKKLMALSGAEDKLVHPSFSQHFLANLLVSEPRVPTTQDEHDQAAGGAGPGGLYQDGLHVQWFQGCKHIVTPEMIQEAGGWIGRWGLTQA